MIASLKAMVRPLLPEYYFRIRHGLRLVELTKSISERECSCCGFHGGFLAFGHPPRIDARCPSCGSLERHRLLYLALKRGEVPFPSAPSDLQMLHFAPEGILRDYFSQHFGGYTTADLYQEGVDKKLNIEKIEEPDSSYDVVVASHILEHVDDLKASAELRRILRVGGVLVAMVPIIEGWENSYESEDVKTDLDRLLHFGQADHVRYFGADFVQRIERSGLKLQKEIVAFGQDCLRYGLIRGEKVFVFEKDR